MYPDRYAILKQGVIIVLRFSGYINHNVISRKAGKISIFQKRTHLLTRIRQLKQVVVLILFLGSGLLQAFQ